MILVYTSIFLENIYKVVHLSKIVCECHIVNKMKKWTFLKMQNSKTKMFKEKNTFQNLKVDISN